MSMLRAGWSLINLDHVVRIQIWRPQGDEEPPIKILLTTGDEVELYDEDAHDFKRVINVPAILDIDAEARKEN